MKLYTEKISTFIQQDTDLFYKLNQYYYISRLVSSTVIIISEGYIIASTKEL